MESLGNSTLGLGKETSQLELRNIVAKQRERRDVGWAFGRGRGRGEGGAAGSNIRESLDEVVFVTDLAALVFGVLLRGGDLVV